MIIDIYLDDNTHERLKKLAEEMGREIRDLAESAVSEAVLEAFRHRNDDPVRRAN